MSSSFATEKKKMKNMLSIIECSNECNKKQCPQVIINNITTCNNPGPAGPAGPTGPTGPAGPMRQMAMSEMLGNTVEMEQKVSCVINNGDTGGIYYNYDDTGFVGYNTNKGDDMYCNPTTLVFNDFNGNASHYSANNLIFYTNNNGSGNLTNSILAFNDTSGNAGYYAANNLIMYNNKIGSVNLTNSQLNFNDVKDNHMNMNPSSIILSDASGNTIKFQPTNIIFSGSGNDVINNNTISNLKCAIMELYKKTGNASPDYL
jgi:hypothetical protein